MSAEKEATIILFALWWYVMCGVTRTSNTSMTFRVASIHPSRPSMRQSDNAIYKLYKFASSVTFGIV